MGRRVEVHLVLVAALAVMNNSRTPIALVEIINTSARAIFAAVLALKDCRGLKRSAMLILRSPLSVHCR
jgi:hypothetical protein